MYTRATKAVRRILNSTSRSSHLIGRRIHLSTRQWTGAKPSLSLSRYRQRTQSLRFSSTASFRNGGSAQLRETFEKCQAEGRSAFVAYVTLGHPDKTATVDIIKGLEEGGADIIELGVPFTDPLADGTVIQAANQRAIANGVKSLQDCLDIARQAREAGVVTPFVFMGYYNPFLQHKASSVEGRSQLDNFMKECQHIGINGFIVVDLPPEESAAFRSRCKDHNLSFIPLIAPTTKQSRMEHLVDCADSFIYCVSLTGTTGERSEISTALPEMLESIRSKTNLPLAIGFGIGNKDQFNSVGKLGDGVVVGSAIIRALQDAADSRSSTSPADLRNVARDTILKISGRDSNSISKVQPSQPSSTSVNPSSTTEDEADRDDTDGFRFGDFGGRYVPETLVGALDELAIEYEKCKMDPSFQEEVDSYNEYIGRPSSLHRADRLTELGGGAQIWLKREDLNHTGAHKINNAVAQALLAKRLGKTRIIAETGAGQHGVASATVCAKLGLPLVVYMGAEDVSRQALNVFRMETMGATVIGVESGSRTLKDAINEAMRDWVTNIHDTHYLVGSAIGPHPFPTIVRDFQCVIGNETRQQFLEKTGQLPDAVVACVGGGSNAIGMFYPFLNDASVRMVGFEAGGDGTDTNRHSATLCKGSPGVLHGTRTFLLQDDRGQITETHSISAGLDYPGVGPEHAHLFESGRAEYKAVTDDQCLEGFQMMCRTEGIIPALETSHAIYGAVELAGTMRKNQHVVINVSGRGDKDLDTVRRVLAEKYQK